VVRRIQMKGWGVVSQLCLFLDTGLAPVGIHKNPKSRGLVPYALAWGVSTGRSLG
jgi:hypothetical protein